MAWRAHQLGQLLAVIIDHFRDLHDFLEFLIDDFRSFTDLYVHFRMLVADPAVGAVFPHRRLRVEDLRLPNYSLEDHVARDLPQRILLKEVVAEAPIERGEEVGPTKQTAHIFLLLIAHLPLELVQHVEQVSA